MHAVPERALAAACDVSDIVIAARWLPHSCKPRWLKADRTMLGKTGGLAIDLGKGRVVTVAEGTGAAWLVARDCAAAVQAESGAERAGCCEGQARSLSEPILSLQGRGYEGLRAKRTSRNWRGPSPSFASR